MAALAVPEDDVQREVVELNDWVRPINVLDSVLEAVLRHHPGLLVLWDKGGPPPQDKAVPLDSQAIAAAISRVRKDTRAL